MIGSPSGSVTFQALLSYPNKPYSQAGQENPRAISLYFAFSEDSSEVAGLIKDSKRK